MSSAGSRRSSYIPSSYSHNIPCELSPYRARLTRFKHCTQFTRDSLPPRNKAQPRPDVQKRYIHPTSNPQTHTERCTQESSSPPSDFPPTHDATSRRSGVNQKPTGTNEAIATSSRNPSKPNQSKPALREPRTSTHAATSPLTLDQS